MVPFIGAGIVMADDLIIPGLEKHRLSPEEKAKRNYEKVKRWRKAHPEKRRDTARRNAKEAYDRDPEKFRERARRDRAAKTPERRKRDQMEAWEWQKRNPKSYILFNAKYRAKRYGVPFTITADDIVIPTHCPVLGIPLEPGWEKGSGYDNSPSLDRIIPDLGYVSGNVAVISFRANSIKRNATAEELTLVGQWVTAETARVRKILGY